MSVPDLTIVSRYELIATPEACETAVSNLSARVARAGDPGVRSYRFFANPGRARPTRGSTTTRPPLGLATTRSPCHGRK